jgi:predicted MPP superfamily phosphohydrolase
VAVIAFVLVSVLGLWSAWLEPGSLRVRRYRLALPAWPTECAGVRVALLADLHVGSPFNGLDKLDRIVTATRDAQPDLVVIAGDFVIHGVVGGHFVPPALIAARLETLAASRRVFAVLGNHDWWYGSGAVGRALTAHGVAVLEDGAVSVSNRACQFWLAGIGDLWEGRHDVGAALGGVPDGVPVLALTHNPDIFPEIPSRVALTLAGHTHGGQVYVPLLGRPVVPSRYGERFAIGHIVEGDRHLFVTPGLGTSIVPVRFLVPPEVSILELHPLR